jgi:NAD+ synthase (glutamine-hydrolysing)
VTPPSSALALQGAEIIFNLSASDEVTGKHEYLRSLIAQQSARCMAGYVYSSCGYGESTTDLVFAGNALIAENGASVREEKKDEATVSTSQFNSFADIIVRGPMNMVESFEGFLQSSVDQARSGRYCRNYLDMNNLKVTSDFTLKGASYSAESVN